VPKKQLLKTAVKKPVKKVEAVVQKVVKAVEETFVEKPLIGALDVE